MKRALEIRAGISDIVPHPINSDPIHGAASIARLARWSIHVRFPTLEIT